MFHLLRCYSCCCSSTCFYLFTWPIHSNIYDLVLLIWLKFNHHQLECTHRTEREREKEKTITRISACCCSLKLNNATFSTMSVSDAGLSMGERLFGAWLDWTVLLELAYEWEMARSNLECTCDGQLPYRTGCWLESTDISLHVVSWNERRAVEGLEGISVTKSRRQVDRADKQRHCSSSSSWNNQWRRRRDWRSTECRRVEGEDEMKINCDFSFVINLLIVRRSRILKVSWSVSRSYSLIRHLKGDAAAADIHLHNSINFTFLHILNITVSGCSSPSAACDQ